MTRTRTRSALAVLALISLLSACVTTRDERPGLPTVDGQSGQGGAAGSGGGAGSGGQAGSAPEPDAGMSHGPPAPNVDAIFEEGCATASVEAELLPVNVLFVLDRSESMACNPPPITASVACESAPARADAAQASKWEITRDALTRAIRALPPQTRVGISFFNNDDACGVQSLPRVPIGPLTPPRVAAIEASLANVEPGGATPLVGATLLAYEHLHQAALDGRIRGKRFVVLLTDGEQSEACIDETRCASAAECTDLLIDEEVPKAAGPGVRIATFVIGAPGSEPARSVLSRIALQGGTAPADCSVALGNCHFDMTRSPDLGAALEDALGRIGGRALSCELPLPEGTEALDRDRVNVVYSSSLGAAPRVLQRDDQLPCDSGANGWQYAADGSAIRLCGAVCDEARNDPAGRMDVVLGCPVVGPD